MEFGTGYLDETPSIDGNTFPNVYDAFGPDQAMTYFEKDRPDLRLVESSIENPIVGVRDIGQSVTEGSRFGSLLKTATDAIRRGAGWIELSTNMGGGAETVGAESYGKEAREALRDIARVNTVKFSSVHTPVNIGNMSGYNPQERGFNEEHRKIEIEEVKKAVSFAADLGAQAVVVHTGEYQRPMSEEKWAKNADGTFKFLSYEEEPGRAVLYLVDDRTGRVVADARKNQFVYEPVFKTVRDPVRNRDRWVDLHGNFIQEDKPEELFKRVAIFDPNTTSFKTKKLTWEHFEEKAAYFNKYYPRKDREWKPEEMFYRTQADNRILQSKGSSLYHGRFYDKESAAKEALEKSLKYYEEIEKNTSPDEAWRLYREDESLHHYAGRGRPFVQLERRKVTDILKDAIKDVEKSMTYIHEASASADSQAAELAETLKHVVPVEVYARKKTTQSYAEAGVYAMKKTQESKYADKPVYIAPENLFPEMGYGSHPEEIIKMVHDARKHMVHLLTSPVIEDPHEQRDTEGNIKKVPNPYYVRHMSPEMAEKKAEDHLKATIDTQHLGMWWKHFQPLPNEEVKETKKRFDKWYMEQIKKMADANIIGHLHVVDSIGAGHHHLPVGQGDLPVKEAVEYIKKHKKFKGTMVSEAWGEESMFGTGRILTETWRAFGSRLRPVNVPSNNMPFGWPGVHHAYGREMQSPYFIFGAYSPSNDWQLWSQIPME
ncbi:hypothetical protein HYY69_08685 [Candidatus Woesearchaeota archaeon]|nr:hypothetical protein [Candidatus Woesearchaeota archaeon]